MRVVTCSVIAMLWFGRADAALTSVENFGANPGALEMLHYVPAGLESDRPLVVVMHGCTQTATSMEVAGWNTLADKHRFAVLYPQQKSANQPLSCFTWYAPTDQARDAGEAASIMSMVDKMIADHRVDPTRVYATGVSAGGAFTAIMLASYPDRFAAGSIMAGLPFKCATTLSEGSSCQQGNAQKTPAQWGDLVRAAAPAATLTWPRVQIWQGSADYTVNPANAHQLVDQWTNVWGIDQTPDASDMISVAMRTQHSAGSVVAIEVYLIEGMGHAIATGDDAMGACPATTGPYFSNQKLCSTLRSAVFFGLADGGGGSGSGSGSEEDPTMSSGCATSEGNALPPCLLVLLLLRARRRA